MVQEALLEHLLVQPRAVESGRHAQLDVAAQCVVAGRRHDPVRVIALVQHQALEHHLAVEPDRLAVDAHRTQCGVAGGRVDHVAGAVEQGDGNVVQVRAPAAHSRRRCSGTGRSRRGARSRSAPHSALAIAPPASLRVARRRISGALPVSGCSRRMTLLARSGVSRGRRSARFGHRLQPHRLPDPGGAHVDGPARAVLPRLLAARLRALAGVAGADGDHRRVSGRRHAVQVAGEGREPAAVAPHLDPVHPHGGVVVDRLEVQQHAPARPGGGNGHAAAVPHGVEKVVVLDAREP